MTTQHISADRAQRAMQQFDEDLARAEKADEHVWIIAVAHRITAEHARTVHAGAEPAILDAESAIVTGLGCYRCEEPYSPRLASRRCRAVP